MVFDFDGTINDGVKLVPEITNRAMHELGREPLRDEQIQELRALPLREAVRTLRIPIWRIPWGIRFVRKQYTELRSQFLPMPGMPNLLRALHEDPGVEGVYIFSLNSRSNVKDFLQQHQLVDCIDEVIGGLGLMQKGRSLRSLMQRYNYKSDQLTIVGDETRDIVAGNEVKARTIAVTWGLGTPERLAQARPSLIVTSVDELVKVLQ